MNTLNRYKIILAFALCSAMFLTACNKYEDGPAFSLLSAKKRIQGNYEIEKVFVNGNDRTSDTDSLNISYIEFSTYEDKTINAMLCEIVASKYGRQGAWRLNDVKTEITIAANCAGGPVYCPPSIIPIMINTNGEVWKILRLTNKEMWLKFEHNGVEYETRLKKT